MSTETSPAVIPLTATITTTTTPVGWWKIALIVVFVLFVICLVVWLVCRNRSGDRHHRHIHAPFTSVTLHEAKLHNASVSGSVLVDRNVAVGGEGSFRSVVTDSISGAGAPISVHDTLIVESGMNIPPQYVTEVHAQCSSAGHYIVTNDSKEIATFLLPKSAVAAGAKIYVTNDTNNDHVLVKSPKGDTIDGEYTTYRVVATKEFLSNGTMDNWAILGG